MVILPKGNPLYENIPVTKVVLPEILDKLNFGGFTGYLRFNFPASVGILFFESGKLISAMLERQDSKLSAVEAMGDIGTQILKGNGSVDVFRLSKDLTMCLHALLHGEVLYKGQELKLIDIKALLEKMKNDRLNGCLSIYTDDRTALIFYKDGAPLGFFHDGCQDIETSATESQKIAALPGAKIDVLSTKTAEELMDYNLLEVVNVTKLWQTALGRHQAEQDKSRKETEERDLRAVDEQLKSLEEDMKEMVSAYLGKVGRTLVEKELSDLGGRRALLNREGATKFLVALEKGAKLLASMSKIQEMLKSLDGEITERTANLAK